MTIEIARADITLAIAVVGAVLGVFNTVRACLKDRPRLRVRISGYITSYGDSGFCIDAANIGHVPVQIRQAGISLSGPFRGQVFYFAPYGGDQLPQMLAPGTSITINAAPGVEDDPRLAHADRAYVRTGLGTHFFAGRGQTRRRFKHLVATGQGAE